MLPSNFVLTLDYKELSEVLGVPKDRRAGERGAKQWHRLLGEHVEPVTVVVCGVAYHRKHI